MIKKILTLLLTLCLAATWCGAIGETYISDGRVILSTDAGITLTIPTAFEYIGENGNLSGYRHVNGDIALMLQVTAITAMEDYLADFDGISVSATRETAVSSDRMRVEILWVEDPNYVAFIGAQDQRTENGLIMELIVVRNDPSVDAAAMTRQLARGFRSISEMLEQDQNEDTWDNYVFFEQVGLGMELPRSMVSQTVPAEGDEGGYIYISNGVCQMMVTFFRCTIGELAVMNEFTSHDYEIYQSNAYSFWQFRPKKADSLATDFLVYPGKEDGTWMLLGFWAEEGVDPETVWRYIDQIYPRVFPLE